MYRTFNCGVGMVICVAADQADKTLQALAQLGEKAWVVGQIVTSSEQEPETILGGI